MAPPVKMTKERHVKGKVKIDWVEIFDTINEAITIHDKDFNIVYSNKSAEEMLKLSSHNILTRKCFKSYHGTLSPPKNCPSCKTLKSGKPSTTELFEPNLNKYIEIKALPLFDKGNNVSGLIHVVRDFSKRKSMEENLLKSQTELKTHAQELEESNIALKVLLKQREKDKKDLEDNIMYNVMNLVAPYLTKLKGSMLKPYELTNLNILESNLKEIISPFSRQLTSDSVSLTPKEVMIVNLIKGGQKDKNIFEIMNMSLDTVKTHRRNIRKKLGLNNKKINLRTYLLSK